MTAPTIAPAMPPMAAPFLVLSFVVEASWASAVIATSSDIMIPAMIFFMGPPYWLPLSSQPRCHNEITYVINLSAHGVGWASDERSPGPSQHIGTSRLIVPRLR